MAVLDCWLYLDAVLLPPHKSKVFSSPNLPLARTGRIVFKSRLGLHCQLTLAHCLPVSVSVSILTILVISHTCTRHSLPARTQSAASFTHGPVHALLIHGLVGVLSHTCTLGWAGLSLITSGELLLASQSLSLSPHFTSDTSRSGGHFLAG